MRNFLLGSVILLSACSDAPDEYRSDSSVVDSVAVMKDTMLPRPQSGILDTVQMSITQSLIPISQEQRENNFKNDTGITVMDTMSGDLNRDKYEDMLVIYSLDNDSVRLLVIFIGTESGELELAEQNDGVVLCKDCGGVYGDPYDGLAIKNGYFSVEHYGGSSWRWTKIITFKYNESQKTWLLHRDAGVSYNVFEPDESETENVSNQEHYGKMKFVEYSSM